MEAVALTSPIFNTLGPHILSAIEKFRHDTNSIKSKQEFKMLRKHLGCLYKLQDKVEETIHELRTSAFHRLYKIIRALGRYCKRLGKKINKYELSHKKHWRVRIMAVICTSAGYDKINKYRSRVQDCEDWYNITLKTLYLTLSQGMPQVARETQYKEELKKHLYRFSLRKYKKMKLVELDLCPKKLEEFAEMALCYATTIATSSTTSTPEPRSQPPQITRCIQYHQEPVPQIQTWGHLRTNPVIAQEYIHYYQRHHRPSDPPAQTHLYVQRPHRASSISQDDRYNHPQYYDQALPSVHAHTPMHPPQTAPTAVQIPKRHPTMLNHRLEPQPEPIQNPDSITSHHPSPPPCHYFDVDATIHRQLRSRSRSTSKISRVIPELRGNQKSDLHKQTCPPVSDYHERETQPTPIHCSDDGQRQHQSSTRRRLSSIKRDFSVAQEQPRHQALEIGGRVNPATSKNLHHRHGSSQSRLSSIRRSDFSEASPRPHKSKMGESRNTPIIYQSDREHSSARRRSSSMNCYSRDVESSSRLPKSRADERKHPPNSSKVLQVELGRHRNQPDSRSSSVGRDSGYGSISGQSPHVTGSSRDENTSSRRPSGESNARIHHSRRSAEPPRGDFSGYEEESSRHPRERSSMDDRQSSVGYLHNRRLDRSKREF